MGFIKCSIKLSEVDKARFYVRDNGEKYLQFVVYENAEPDQYGNTHVLKEDNTKEEREAKRKARIIGNGKEIGQKRSAPVQQRPPVQTQRKPLDPDLDPEECPF